MPPYRIRPGVTTGVTRMIMSVEDEKRAQWGAKLRTKDELWVREQANRQLQPNIWKRVAAEQELARREREWGLAKANERIGDLESELAGEAKKMARRSESPARQAANLTPGGDDGRYSEVAATHCGIREV